MPAKGTSFPLAGRKRIRACGRGRHKPDKSEEAVEAGTKPGRSEEAVEAVLASHDMVWTRSETSIDAERMYEVVYEMDVVITKENNNG